MVFSMELDLWQANRLQYSHWGLVWMFLWLFSLKGISPLQRPCTWGDIIACKRNPATSGKWETSLSWKHPIVLKHTYWRKSLPNFSIFHLHLTCQFLHRIPRFPSFFANHLRLLNVELLQTSPNIETNIASPSFRASNPAPLSAVFLFGGDDVAETDETGSLRQCFFFLVACSCRGSLTWKDRFLRRTSQFADCSCWVLFRWLQES